MSDLDVERRYNFERLERQSKRTRWAKRLIAPGAVLAVLLTGASAYVANYLPLVGGLSGRTEGVHDCVRYLGEFSRRGLGDDFRVSELACFRNGDRAVIGFTIRNAGPLPVTIMRIDTKMAQFLSDGVVSVAARDTPQNLFPFQPFRLASGEERWMEVETRVTACGDESQYGFGGNRFGWRVAYKVGPIARSDTYYGMQFRAECPHPDPEP